MRGILAETQQRGVSVAAIGVVEVFGQSIENIVGRRSDTERRSDHGAVHHRLIRRQSSQRAGKLEAQVVAEREDAAGRHLQQAAIGFLLENAHVDAERQSACRSTGSIVQVDECERVELCTRMQRSVELEQERTSCREQPVWIGVELRRHAGGAVARSGRHQVQFGLGKAAEEVVWIRRSLERNGDSQRIRGIRMCREEVGIDSTHEGPGAVSDADRVTLARRESGVAVVDAFGDLGDFTRGESGYEANDRSLDEVATGDCIAVSVLHADALAIDLSGIRRVVEDELDGLNQRGIGGRLSVGLLQSSLRIRKANGQQRRLSCERSAGTAASTTAARQNTCS